MPHVECISSITKLSVAEDMDWVGHSTVQPPIDNGSKVVAENYTHPLMSSELKRL